MNGGEWGVSPWQPPEEVERRATRQGRIARKWRFALMRPDAWAGT
jgi:hypothetical protein